MPSDTAAASASPMAVRADDVALCSLGANGRKRQPERHCGADVELLHLALAVVEVKLLLRYIKPGAVPVAAPIDPADRSDDAPLVFAY